MAFLLYGTYMQQTHTHSHTIIEKTFIQWGFETPFHLKFSACALHIMHSLLQFFFVDVTA